MKLNVSGVFTVPFYRTGWTVDAGYFLGFKAESDGRLLTVVEGLVEVWNWPQFLWR